MLPLLKRQRAEKDAEMKALDAKIKNLESALGDSGMDDGIPSFEGTPPSFGGGVTGNHPPKTPEGRIKRGESAKLIGGFLESKNGQGATIKQITDATGTVYGTARRILHDLRKQKLVRARAGVWKWQTDTK